MPKNPHPPRGGGGSKKSSAPSPATNNGEDTSYIVFSNAKGEPKNKKDGKAKEEAKPEEGPKKPDTRTLIGGASWTGKLPVNMLSEHCQKLKWEKPEYTMNKISEGFISSVILKYTNPKTRETTILPPIKFPPDQKAIAAQPSAVEARHFAATYALFRVGNMKNYHMMMPPNYRDLWKGMFQDMKKADTKDGRGWMYEADPFVAFKEREDAKAAATKKREDAAVQKEKQQSQGGGAGLATGNGGNKMKGWTRVPKIEMGKRIRAEVESLIRRDAAWNPHNVQLPAHVRSRLVAEISELGFRKSHVEEAAEICKDREEILEWLLIHVPEDDLPPWSLPEGYTAGISMASGNLKREAAIKRLAASGYAIELCEETFDACKSDEAKAASLLQARLLGADQLEDMSYLSIEDAEEEGKESWAEEQTTLLAIYDEKYQSSAPDQCEIRLELVKDIKIPVSLLVRRPPGAYPNVLPIISIQAKIPAYIRLSIIRQALLHAKENFLGDQMIFNIVDWLEHEIPGIIDRPGRLTEVSAGNAAADARSDTRRQQRKQYRRHQPRKIDWRPGSQISKRIFEQWQAKQTTPAQERMLKGRQGLPAWRLQEDIVDAVNDHQVVIISGETGSGKSTQSVQFVLDDLIKRQLGEAANIVCTQPRRISALGLADRVADERCGIVGDEVGYAIRGESKQKQGITKITFVTTGVLLRRLQTSGGSAEDVVASLADVSHVVVDEVHERSLDTDFLLVLLRDVLKQRKDLKVILMSATLDAEVFAKYFEAAVGKVGMIEIQGRTHPVQDYYVDDVVRMSGFNGHTFDEEWDEEVAQKQMSESLKGIGMRINYDLIAQTVQMIDAQLGSQDGGVLIFLPGTMEIDRTIQALRYLPNIYALPLHASLLPTEQRRVFPPAPAGKRKVIASTNVAETSITIEDIVAVIDTGRVKETSFDPANNMVKLGEVWASRAACKQRRGRAGRVRAGSCYKLYTRNAEKTQMMERPEPEIRRVPLEQLCLSVKAMGVKDVPGFLAGALTPPDSIAVEGAIELLQRMGAIDGDEMTALGRHLSTVPADLCCAKLMIYGATFGCLDACLTIAAILTVRSPFVSPQAKREESKAARSSFGKGQGDLIADLRAYETWAAMREKGISGRDLRAWCEQNFLSTQTLFDVSSNRSQYLSSLQETGFIPLNRYNHRDAAATQQLANLNKYNTNDALIRALIAGSFTPQIARIDFPDQKYSASVSGAVALDPEARTIKYFNQENGRVFVHPSSTLFDAQTFPGNAAFVAYFSKMATSKVFVREVTPFNGYGALFFGGAIGLDTLGRGLLVDGWVRLRGWARIGVLVGRLRRLLDEGLMGKIEDPGVDLVGSGVVDVVRRLVELDGLDR
ncbi:P-loop containing nucleoside triphosphate hydrolase protein [Saccharata proteae CBS 121410]|uniref:P-loop containing nucleoside triphosphate hydrolase protein n=1 Tax=Saccharata proteae CBS 121410 TaxID=1314787 RepID=A0A9P4HYF6_9PEZI|nr:P-loop containing nucleoside triphosphate hydrolase protein [Saccharata proteae CBS 121410]